MINFNDKKAVASVLQFTNVNPTLTKKELIEHLELCKEYVFNAAMIPPCYVSFAKDYLKGTSIKVASILNFPTANDSLSMKMAALEQLVADGVDEFDFPPNPGYLIGGQEDLYFEEMKQITEYAHQHGVGVKVMLEFGFLNEQQKIRAVELACKANVDWLKNSSGWGEGGSAATVEDVILIKKHMFGISKIKVSGKVNSLEKLIALMEAGASLAGTSSAVKIMQGLVGDVKAY
ncbi:MAG: deoxyribose-phosphate aldolase [Firmicutes bacterium HGW-Firmicutes-20]|jgi:deoxyribose-phosphate aldolase|nr:MAG: deoxyribose-phosphate aldolase [Firmicutes bacterium HGW-Firmicutes-20]PKM86921.1 MAG: deoxyribose-phosphate aldolase [Firmicutes bacterium HGW-Firmicutes-10]